MIVAAASILCSVCLLLALPDASPAGEKPPLARNGCKLVSGDDIKDLMGRRVVARRGGGPEGCVWTTRRAVPGDAPRGRNAEEAGVGLAGYKNASQGQEYVELTIRNNNDWKRLRGGRSVGTEGYLHYTGNVMFRVGRVVGHVNTYTNNVQEGGSADVRRTIELAQLAARGLRRYRLPRGLW